MSHITEIETIANQLRDINAPVTVSQIMTKIICTLPPSYRGFISAWESVPVTDSTIDTLTSRLLTVPTTSIGSPPANFGVLTRAR